MDREELFLAAVAVILAVSVVSVFSFGFRPEYLIPVQGKCSLSLCDCGCYPEGQTPEELTGRLCGINCLGEFNVSGCVSAGGTCAVRYANGSSALPQEYLSCRDDSDCVPAWCCHPDFCVNRQFGPGCEGIACTMHCAPGTMDCGQGRCGCVDNRCGVIWPGSSY